MGDKKFWHKGVAKATGAADQGKKKLKSQQWRAHSNVALKGEDGRRGANGSVAVG